MKRSFSARLPGGGGASMSAYLDAAVELKAEVVVGTDELDGFEAEELKGCDLLEPVRLVDEIVGGAEDADAADDPRL